MLWISFIHFLSMFTVSLHWLCPLTQKSLLLIRKIFFLAFLCHKITTCEGLLQKMCISANILIWELLPPGLVIAPQICQAVISTVTVVKVAGVGNAYCGVCWIQDFLFKVLQLLLFNIPIACFIDPFSGASLLSCTVVYFIWLLGLSSWDMCLCAGVTTADKAVRLTCCVLWAVWLVGSFSCRLIKWSIRWSCVSPDGWSSDSASHLSHCLCQWNH